MNIDAGLTTSSSLQLEIVGERLCPERSLHQGARWFVRRRRSIALRSGVPAS